MDHVAVDVGEAEVAALEAVGELRVVEAEQMQDRGLEVVHMHFVPGDVEELLEQGADLLRRDCVDAEATAGVEAEMAAWGDALASGAMPLAASLMRSKPR